MAPSSMVTVLEECHISPPPSSPPTTSSLLLTFFDIPWLLFPPSQPLFFYHYFSSSEHFASTILPKLKHSLSSALLHFLPFAGKIAFRPGPTKPELVYTYGDTVKVTVAEVAGYDRQDLDRLCSNDHQKDALLLHQLVPRCLQVTLRNDVVLSDLLAVQITCFPKAGGFSIGLAYPHVACDQRTFNNFMKTWASFCKIGWPDIGPGPSFDRASFMGQNGLEPILMNQWWRRGGWSAINESTGMGLRESIGLVRSTFVMGPVDIENAKNWIQAQCSKKKSPRPILLSPYVVACSLIWVCMAKAQYRPAHNSVAEQGPIYFGFIAGGISRLSYRVPSNYFGNCVAFGRAAVARWEELVSDSGIEVAAAAIAQTVKRLDGDVLGGAEKWIEDWEMVVGSDIHVNVVGSPKVDLYKTDFGWGRPEKIEEVAIDVMRGVSLCESRDMKGGIEIGVALSKPKMDIFTTLFSKGLEEFSVAASGSVVEI